MQTNNQNRTYLLDFSREELTQYIRELGFESYRADQIFKGIYHQLLSDFQPLSTLSRSLRHQLDHITDLRQLTLKARVNSSHDNTTKFLWELNDARFVESVIIYEGKRITYCISTQVGCALDCRFCATAKMGFLRNLSAGEIVEQVIQMNNSEQILPTNVVFMGMGEPLLNRQNVLKAAHLMSDPEGMTIARKRITISTSGIVPAIQKLADSDFPFSLAVSLNAPDDYKRRMLMPVTERFPLKELVESLVYFYSKTKSRITFEYVLIAGMNDSREDAENLVKICRRIPSKINLIPCNSHDPQFKAPADVQINRFATYLRDHFCTVTTRLRKGFDIDAACGQLYTRHAGSKKPGIVRHK